MDQGERGDSLTTDGGPGSIVECSGQESTIDAIVRGVAAIEGVPETELRSLYEEVDLEAVERLVQHAKDHDSPVRVQFTDAEYTVCIRGDDSVRIVDSSHSLALDGEHSTA